MDCFKPLGRLTRARTRTVRFTKPLATAGFIALLHGGLANAANFSVSNEIELRDALLISASNGENDEINLGANTITLNDGQLELLSEPGFTVRVRNGTITRAADADDFRLLKVGSIVPPADQTNASVTLLRVNFSNGSYDTSNGPSTEAGGGAIFTDIPLTIDRSRLDNNTVTGDGYGGAVYSTAGRLFLDEVNFTNNRAIAAGNGEAAGGAVASRSQSTLRAFRVVMDGNSANRGGAFFLNANSEDSFIQFSTLMNNSAVTLGGALWTSDQNTQLNYTTFYNNSAGTGGGAIYAQEIPSDSTDASITISSSTIVGNDGGNNAGGIYFDPNAGQPSLASVILTDNGINCSVVGVQAPATSNLFKVLADDESCGTGAELILVPNSESVFRTGMAEDNGNVDVFVDNFFTIALSANSPAIDAAGQLCFNADQRSFPSPALDACDIGAYEFQPGEGDEDGDGIADADDNCPSVANEDQTDTDGDNAGDACDSDDDNDGTPDNADAFPLDPNESADSDGDNIGDNGDNCPFAANPEQENLDGDNDGDACDSDIDGDGVDNDVDAFPEDANESVDTDGDGIGNNADTDDDGDLQLDADEQACGSDPLLASSVSPDADNDNIPDCVDEDFVDDTDGDGVADDIDNCPSIANSNQDDLNGDGEGDACDSDIDGDGVENASDAFPRDPNESVDTDTDGFGDNADNCPVVANPGQEDLDGDGDGDACDTDIDGDGVDNDNDAFPDDANESVDTDGDGIGNNADTDDDDDGQSDANELNCGSDPLLATSTSADQDNDGIPDCVDDDFVPDTDGDGVNDDVDNCPAIVNADQDNLDGDNLGDACDNDIDGDGVDNGDDVFPLNPAESADNDGDGTGDNADFDDDNDGQLDEDELECGSDPLDASSTSPDSNGNGIPDCVDDTDPVAVPMCRGVEATIYVKDGLIVGGPDNGKHYRGRLRGTNGDDVIVGTKWRDRIDGRKGNDRICGRRSADDLRGGQGNDVIYGGRGNDWIRGGKGNDTLYGNRGYDYIRGDQGHDSAFGGRNSANCRSVETSQNCH